jgi:type IV secretory pathway VirB10-like protein
MSDEKALHVHTETTDEETSEVVHGVAESVVGAATPKAKRIRPLAGVVLLVLVALTGVYMRHEMKERQQKVTARAQTPKAGQGPAAQLERAMLDDQAKHGLDTGQSHLASSLFPRPSLTEGAPAPNAGSAATVPRLEYRESVGARGQLPGADERRVHEYQLEQEAMEAGTATGGRGSLNFSSPNPNNGSVEEELAKTRANEANLRAQIEKIASGDGGQGAANLLGALRSALATGTPPPAALSAGNSPMAMPFNAQTSEYEHQNSQMEKQQFLDRASSAAASTGLPYARTPAISKYEIKQGWLIPAVLEEELDSDLPGMIRALVRENVYDSVSGKYLLIPQGTRIIGVYNSNIGFGQGGVQTVWRRILFPDGSSLNLGGFEGNDREGGSGLRDQVDNHWKRVLSGALLTSLFAAGLQISQGQNNSALSTQSFGQQLSAGVGTQVGELGQQVTRRNLNIQPTIQIRPGYRFFVRVEKDMRFQAPYAPSPPSYGFRPE